MAALGDTGLPGRAAVKNGLANIAKKEACLGRKLFLGL